MKRRDFLKSVGIGTGTAMLLTLPISLSGHVPKEGKLLKLSNIVPGSTVLIAKNTGEYNPITDEDIIYNNIVHKSELEVPIYEVEYDVTVRIRNGGSMPYKPMELRGIHLGEEGNWIHVAQQLDPIIN